jgi:Flp pilus assembly protein TadG
MKEDIISHKKERFGFRGQALVEFAIALPVLLVLLVGMMEVGRMLLTYALVSNASRDAVRYASSVGLDDSGTYQKYLYCDGIKAAARSSAYFVSLTTITISYDTGPSTSSIGNCGAVTAAQISSGNRVTVTVTASYKPVVKLIPISQRTFTSTSSRTILGIVDLEN